MSLATRLPRVWYGDAPAPRSLRALVPVYRALRALHRAPYTLGWRKPAHLPVPVVAVGNITAGGTGKTPLVIALVQALRERGHRPGVISRGYGGSAGVAEVPDGANDTARYGDEPVLIRAASAAPVAVGADRVAAATLLLASHDCDVLIADDGLQHDALFRDAEICVIDGERRFGNGYLLPAGPLREPISRLTSVAFRVCNGGVARTDEIPMQLVGDIAVALADASLQRALGDFSSSPVHAVAGIGNPDRFFNMLRRARLQVIEHPLSDHYRFSPADLIYGDDLPILMTAKDAVKCGLFDRSGLWQVPVAAQLPGHFYDALVTRLFG